MNDSLQKAFDTLETSLATLIDSVSSNNPSTSAAHVLVAADDEVTARLDQLIKHQHNYATLQRLRALTTSLDSELTTLLTSLSNARSELVSVPSTRFRSDDYRRVDYESLLAYATKISKFTRNPSGSGAAAAAAAIASSSAPQPDAELAANGEKTANGDTTMGNDKTNDDGAGATSKNKFQPTDEEAAMLDPSRNMPFAPWPNEEIMRRGILARMQFEEWDVAKPTAIEAPPSQEQQQQQQEQQQQQQPQPPPPPLQTSEADRMNSGTGELPPEQQATGADRPAEAPGQNPPTRRDSERKVFTGLLDLYDPEED